MLQSSIFQHVELRRLETDITGLRGACDDMSKRVSSMTAGKGEDNIPEYIEINGQSIN